MNRLCLFAALLFLLVILVESTPDTQVGPASPLLYTLEGKEGSPQKGLGSRGRVGAASPLWISPLKLASFNCRNISPLSTWKKKGKLEFKKNIYIYIPPKIPSQGPHL